MSTVNLVLLSPLTDFVNIIAAHFAEIWGFLILLGEASAGIAVIAVAILWFADTNMSRRMEYTFVRCQEGKRAALSRTSL